MQHNVASYIDDMYRRCCGPERTNFRGIFTMGENGGLEMANFLPLFILRRFGLERTAFGQYNHWKNVVVQKGLILDILRHCSLSEYVCGEINKF